MTDNRSKLIDLLSDDNDWMAPWLRQEIRSVIAENVVLINKYVDLRRGIERIMLDARADDNHETASRIQRILKP